MLNRSNITTTKTISSLFLAFMLIAGTIITTTTVSVYGQGQANQPVTRSEFQATINQLLQADAAFQAAILELQQDLANVVTDEELQLALADLVKNIDFQAAILDLQQTDVAFQAAILDLQQTDS